MKLYKQKAVQMMWILFIQTKLLENIIVEYENNINSQEK